MFSQIGPLELVIVLVIVLVIFGPRRLPGLGRQLGRGMREFRESVTGEDKDDDDKQSPRVLAETHPEPAAAKPAERTTADVGSEPPRS